MARLVGIGGFLVVIAVAGLFLGFGAYFVEDIEDARTDQVPPVNAGAKAVMIDPACLWPLLDVSVSPDAPQAPSQVTLRGCSPADAETEVDGGWSRVSLQRGEPGDAGFERRFSGARLSHLSDDGWIALEAYDNWGGSGVFSSLVIGRITDDGKNLADIKVHAFGDRCNGGLAATRVELGGRIIANANMTPWDIMMVPLSDLPFDDQWQAGKSRFGGALGGAASCAICCSAVTREYVADRRGDLTPVGLRYDPGVTPSSEDALGACLEEAVRQLAGPDALVEASEWAALGDLIDACVQDLSN